MNLDKQNRNVRDMGVLNDIRGLLSTSPVDKQSGTAESEVVARLNTEINGYKDEVERLGLLVEQQQRDLERLQRDNEALAAESEALRSEKAETPVVEGGGESLDELEERKSDLTLAISELEGLLQFKLKEPYSMVGIPTQMTQTCSYLDILFPL